MCFGLSDRGKGLPMPNRPHYSKAKDDRASVETPYGLNDQAARLAKREEQSGPKSKDFTETSAETGYIGCADEECVCRQHATFEDFVKRGVITKTALDACLKSHKRC